MIFSDLDSLSGILNNQWNSYEHNIKAGDMKKQVLSPNIYDLHFLGTFGDMRQITRIAHSHYRLRTRSLTLTF
ncbi:hypothetical protein ACHQM5_013512 [Ranunculus cassubicifolius]